MVENCLFGNNFMEKIIFFVYILQVYFSILLYLFFVIVESSFQ